MRVVLPSATVVIAIALAATGCSKRQDSRTQIAPANSPGARHADVVVTDLGSSAPVSLRIGQTLGIVAPSSTATYQVDFSSAQLQLLTPAQSISRPGDQGWVWRAIGAGQLDLQVTARAACPQPPCGENPQRYTLAVTITGSSAAAPASPIRRAEPRDEDRRGADQPDEAIRWRQIFERDEFGRIAPDGLMNARRHVDDMRARRPLGGGESIESGAGISPGGWTWIGPGNIGGRTRAIAVHPTTTSTLFAGAVGGGIWKSTNSGGTWNAVDDFMANLAVSAILFDPTNPSIMYAGTGEGFFNADAIRGAGIFKSVNGGSTWTQLAFTAPGVSSDFLFVNELAIAPDGSVLLAATGTGIWRSIDDGASWSRPLSQSQMMDVKFIPGSSSLAVAAGRSKNCFYSVDGGLNWTASTGMTTGGTKRVELGVSVSQPSTVYASVAEGNTSSTPPAEVWKSTNSGVSFTLVNNQSTSLLGTQGWYDNAIWVDPTNVNHILVAGVSVFRSTDGGVSFSSPFSSGHSDNHTFVSDPGFNGTTNKRVYSGNDGGVYKWENVSVTSTTKLNNNYGVTQFYGADGLTSNGRIFGGTQDNGTLLYTPASGPQAWSSIAGGDGGFATADSVNNYLYGEFQWLQVHRSVNGGSSSFINGCSKAAPYSLDDGCTSSSSTTNFIAPILLDPNSPDRLYAGGYKLWRSNDPRAPNTSTTGPTWGSIKASVSSAISAIAITKTDSNRIWIGHNNGNVYSTGNGLSATPSWTQRDLAAPGLPNRAVTSIAVDPLDGDTVYVAFGGFNTGNLWVTHNNGGSWSDATGMAGSQLPAAPVRAVIRHPTAPGWLYAGTDVGVFASQDGGLTWTLPQDGPANVAVFQLFFMSTTLVAVTHGRGLFTIDVAAPGAPPSIASHPQSQSIALGQTANLSVTAQGTGPFSYQWYQGASPSTASPIAGATSSSYATPSLQTTTSYWVRVTNASGNADSTTAVVTVSSLGPELMQNGGFTTGLTNWQTFDGSNIVHNGGAGGEFRYHRNPVVTASGQAAVFQTTGAAVSGSFGLTAQFTLGNLDTIRKRITVLIVDSDFSDLTACTFWLAPSAPMRPYSMSTHGTRNWTNAAIYFYGASIGTGDYRLSDVSLKADSGASTSRTTCTDPAAPLPLGGPVGPNLLTNGDFNAGLAPWQPFFDLIHQVSGGVFQFLLPGNPGQASGGILQSTGQTMNAGEILTATFQLGNSSGVRKRVTVLVHDFNFTDLAACTFFIAAGAPLGDYGLRMATTKTWDNASVSVYASTVGPEQWSLVDNVTLQRTPGSVALGTECAEPGSPLLPEPIPLSDRETLAEKNMGGREVPPPIVWRRRSS